MPITFEGVLRKEAKEKGIKFTKEEQQEMDKVEASTTPVNKKAKIWTILKLTGSAGFILSVWWWFKGRHSGLFAPKAVAAAITP